MCRTSPRQHIVPAVVSSSVSAVCLAVCLVVADSQATWTYADQDGWAQHWQMCGVAGQQAPINLQTEKADPKAPPGGWELETSAVGVQSLGPLEWKSTWPKANVSLSTGGGTWTVALTKNYTRSIRIRLFGTSYYLESFHYHSPSEMWVDGRGYDMEAQFMHKSDDGRPLVLSVLLQVGLVEPNKFLAQFFEDVPMPGEPPAHKHIYGPYAEGAVDALPEDRTFFAFNASLSEPPCTLGTLWVVLRQPVMISYTQRDHFRSQLNSTQPRVLRYGPTPKGVIMPWSIDGDSQVGMNNRRIQQYPIQAVLATMAPRETSTTTPLPEEAPVWVWLVVAALLFVLVSGLCILATLLCTGLDEARKLESGEGLLESGSDS